MLRGESVHDPPQWFGIAAATRLAGIGWLGSQTPSYETCITQQEKRAENDKAKATFEVVAGRVLRCEGVFADANGNTVTALATALLTAVTLGLLLLAGAQIRTSRAELRGYVFPRMGSVTISEGKPPSMQVTIKNFGATPVRRLAHTGSAVVLAPDIKIETRIPKGVRPDLALAPNEEHLSQIDRADPLTSEEISLIKDRKKALYFAGLIVYRDAFGERRETRYAWVWIGETRPGGDFKISHTTKGNTWA